MKLLKASLKIGNFVRTIRRFSSERPYREISIPVPWGVVRGKWWGPTNIRPILALHGWQDNCGTFDRLIPLLNKDLSFLAIDFPGHGYSSRFPTGFYYHFTTYIFTLKFIKQYFQWPKVSLMGHSMGGITSYTYTMLYPQNVDFTACIDGAKPMVLRNRVGTMSKSFDKFMRFNTFAESIEEPPSYTIEEINQKIHAPNRGSVLVEYAPYLMKRNTAPSKLYPGKYYFTRDPRLKCPELLSFSQNELVEHAQNITCPIFITKSKDASYYEVKDNFYEVLDVLKRSSQDCDFHYVEGTHHAHLNNPEEISVLLRKFIQKHNIEDRSIGGMKEEMLVTEEEDPRIKLSN